jgi:hypothetical protein
MDEKTVIGMIREARRRITDTLPGGEACTSTALTLTPAQAQALLEETRYELEPEQSPTSVAEVREQLEAGTYRPSPNVVLARIATQRRCVAGRRFLEALAGLPDGSWPCFLQEYRCERWSQVSSLYWSCVMESLAP